MIRAQAHLLSYLFKIWLILEMRVDVFYRFGNSVIIHLILGSHMINCSPKLILSPTAVNPKLAQLFNRFVFSANFKHRKSLLVKRSKIGVFKLHLQRSAVIMFEYSQMDFEYKTLSTQELLDILTKSTMRYNHILLKGGSTDEFEMLREAIKLLQQEVAKRKDQE